MHACAICSLARLPSQALVKLAHLVSYEAMGQMRVDCIAHCSCNSTLIDNHNTKVCMGTHCYTIRSCGAVRCDDIMSCRVFYGRAV